MRIRLGAPYFTPDNKSKIPANEGLTDHVNREIEYTMTTANKAYENALEADGNSVLLWRKTREGRRCTCKDSQPNSESTNSRFDDNPVKTENAPIRVKGSWDKSNRKQNFHGETLGVDIGRITPDNFSDKQEITKFDTIDRDEIDAFLNGPTDNRALYSGDSTTACGICLGSGFTNGYSLYRGQRLTFDTLNVNKNRGFRVDKGKRPYIFTTSGDTVNQFVEWEFELPSYFLDVLTIQVRNNLASARHLRITIGKNNNFVPATKKAVSDLKNTPGSCKIRVEPFETEGRREISFTHVELILQFSPWIKTQIPSLQSTSSFAAPETINSMEIYLPPSVDKVGNEDLLTEFKYNKAWIISEVVDLQTARKQILNWTMQAKSLATFDVRSLIRISREPEYAVNFTGLKGDY